VLLNVYKLISALDLRALPLEVVLGQVSSCIAVNVIHAVKLYFCVIHIGRDHEASVVRLDDVNIKVSLIILVVKNQIGLLISHLLHLLLDFLFLMLGHRHFRSDHSLLQQEILKTFRLELLKYFRIDSLAYFVRIHMNSPAVVELDNNEQPVDPFDQRRVPRKLFDNKAHVAYFGDYLLVDLVFLLQFKGKLSLEALPEDNLPGLFVKRNAILLVFELLSDVLGPLPNFRDLFEEVSEGDGAWLTLNFVSYSV